MPGLFEGWQRPVCGRQEKECRLTASLLSPGVLLPVKHGLFWFIPWSNKVEKLSVCDILFYELKILPAPEGCVEHSVRK